MVFCSCIYNEIFVLYCFGLEKSTHLNIINSKENLDVDLHILNSNVDLDEDDKNLSEDDD